MVKEPTLFLDSTLNDLLNRLLQVDVTKWQALHELGLPAVPSEGRPNPA